MAIIMQASSTSVSKLAVTRKAVAAKRVICRSAPEDTPMAPPPAAAPVPPVSTSVRSTPAPAQFNIREVMAFSGPAPEIVNGRLAMLGFVAALGAELSTDTSMLKQLSAEPTGITFAFVLVIAGSFVTIMQRKEGKLSMGPFTPAAELLNGRAAMMGFAAMLAIEVSKGAALF